jgi:DNA-binding transcriptional MocR family regulator
MTSANAPTPVAIAKNLDSVRFGRVPAEVIEAGALAKMTGAEAKVYLAICSHANHAWKAWPGCDRIEVETGLSRSTVKAAVKALDEQGAITVEHGGGRGHSNRYTINSPLGRTLLTAKGSNSGVQRVRFCPTKGPLGRTPTDKNRDRTERPSASRSQDQKRKPPAAVAALLAPPQPRRPGLSLEEQKAIVRAEAADTKAKTAALQEAKP